MSSIEVCCVKAECRAAMCRGYFRAAVSVLWSCVMTSPDSSAALSGFL